MMLPFLACGTLQIKLSPLENDRVKLALASWKDHSARNPSDFELIAAWARDDVGLVRPAAARMPLACTSIASHTISIACPEVQSRVGVGER